MAELRVKGTGTLKLFENDNTSSVTIASPASLGADRTITLPDADVTLVSGTMSTGLTAADITGQTALGAEPADTDEFVLSDAGVLKRVDYSYIKGAGKVLQVVSTASATAYSTTSNSWQTATNPNATITPSATSSTILILGSQGHLRDGSDHLAASFRREISGGASTDNIVGTTFGILLIEGTSSAQLGGLSFIYEDSPSTTSAVTYKFNFRNLDDSSTVSFGSASMKAAITLMEIDGS